MSLTKEIELLSLFIDLEAELRTQQLWRTSPLLASAYLSHEPFCFDTMTFTEWLQFVFLPKIRDIIDKQQTLPDKCSIAPMAEEYFKDASEDGTRIIQLLARIDALLTN